jgi:hypothetical protein
MGEGLNIRNANSAPAVEDEDYSLKFPKEYHGKTPVNTKVVE